MEGEALNLVDDKLEQLKTLLPEAFTEGKVDWDKLRLTLGDDVNFSDERYVLNWAGKSDAFRVLQTPTTATLAPTEKESVNFNETKNTFIEGENLEALKVLQKAYYGKIKMIYIDPPYNTGNDSFVYPDRFSESREEYLKRINDKDEEGMMMREGIFRKNSKDSGHYHSNWLSMMYPRLFLAKNLLSSDGVLFVSIDDNEVHNLKLLLNELFGEENFVAMFPWRKRTAKSDVPFGVSQDFEWILMYVKGGFQAGEHIERNYYKSDDFEDGWRLSDLTTQRTKDERPNSYFPMVNPKTGKTYDPNPNRVWGVTKDTFEKYYKKGKIVFPGDYDFLNISRPVYRVFESEDREKNIAKFGTEIAQKAISTLLPKEVGRTEDGTKEVTELFGSKVFPFPKPTSLIKHLIKTTPEIDFTVLDFFAGSATLAHAVLELNNEDGGNRKFICIQLPEKTEENSDAFNAGYKTIADIGIERIRRVIEKIKKENPMFADNGQDLGFRVFKLKHSNFKLWRGDGIEKQDQLEEQLDMLADPVRPEALEENMLYELLLKTGYPLTTQVEKRDIEKEHYYTVDGELAIALSHVSAAIIQDMLEVAPQQVICLDSLFDDNDPLKTNTQLQFKDAGIAFHSI